MSDEVLIQTIRVAMRDEVASLHPPAELLAGVAVPGPARRRPSLSWLGPALAVGIAVAVAVIALTSLTHRSSGSHGAFSHMPRAAHGLASHLAVLRRRQIPQDILPRWAVRETESLTRTAGLIGGLSRLVGAVHLGQYGRARVYLVVQRPPRFPLHTNHPEPPLLNPRLGDQATIAFVGPFREEAAINGPTVAAGGQTVAAIDHGLTADPGQFAELWGSVASIVPDGVARVKWVFGTETRVTKYITVWPAVRDNLALGRILARPQVYMRTAIWYGPGGRVISTFGVSNPAADAGRFKRALEASLHQRIDPSLLAHFAVLRTRPHAPGLDHSEATSLLEPNPLGLNTSGARFVAEISGLAKVFVVPGSQGMALMLVRPGTGLAEVGTAAALSGSLTIETPLFSGHRLVIGLAPDGNRTVTVLLHGGGQRSAEVTDNVYAAIVPGRAKTVVLRNAAGRTVRLRVG